ncbi:MAG: hypothetical protein RLZZ505_1866 [Verrucomicrobiota bacterium]|jgi:uncharacterized membrane protein YkoI
MKTLHTIASIALSSTLAFAEYEKEIRLDDCPAPVRETIQANARDGKIDEIELISIGEKRIYIAEVDLPRDIDLKVFVNGDGTLVKTREDVRNDGIPAFVGQVAGELGGTVEDVEMETAGKTVTYHVDIERQGAPDLDVVLDAAGKVISKTEEADD